LYNKDISPEADKDLFAKELVKQLRSMPGEAHFARVRFGSTANGRGSTDPDTHSKCSHTTLAQYAKDEEVI
jgi:hypothetical protein